MSKENKLHIRVQRSQPAVALQEYTRQVMEAATHGFVLTDDIKSHARPMGMADYSVVLERKEEGAEALEELTAQAQESGEYDTKDVQESVGGDFPVLAESVEIVPETGELPPNGNNDEEGMSISAKGFYQGQNDNDTEDSDDDLVGIDFDSLKTKKELLSYAKEHNIEVPDDKKNVSSIRKYLKSL